MWGERGGHLLSTHLAGWRVFFFYFLLGEVGTKKLGEGKARRRMGQIIPVDKQSFTTTQTPHKCIQTTKLRTHSITLLHKSIFCGTNHAHSWIIISFSIIGINSRCNRLTQLLRYVTKYNECDDITDQTTHMLNRITGFLIL